MKAVLGFVLLAVVCSAEFDLVDYLSRLPATAEPVEALDPVPFTFTNCGDPNSDLLKVETITVSPMPVTTGAYINASLVADLALPIKAAHVELLVERQMTKSTWMKIPCISDVGSCVYKDACEYASKISECPSWIGFDCKCPVPAQQYKYSFTHKGPVPEIPAVAKGNFRVTVKATETTVNKQIACFIVTASTR